MDLLGSQEGWQLGPFLPSERLAMSTDIFVCHNLRERVLLASDGQKLLNILQGPEQPPPPSPFTSKNYRAPNINSAEVEKPWGRRHSGEKFRGPGRTKWGWGLGRDKEKAACLVATDPFLPRDTHFSVWVIQALILRPALCLQSVSGVVPV